MPDPSIERASVWNTRPVFISSTFKDMQAERDWLNQQVFPRLEEALRQRRHHLEPIDLRVGVDTAQVESEAGREMRVLKVCLEEIQRSRPFLLVLLGDRYGWTPPAERMEAATREQGFETDMQGKSVTALEIEYGILKKDPEQKRRSLFFFRKPLTYQDMPEALRGDYSDEYAADPAVRADHAKLAALKEGLRRDPELGPHIHDYAAAWDAKQQRVSGLQAFGDLVYQELWQALEEETRAWAALPPPTWEQQEIAALDEFVEHQSRIFVGREALIDQLLTLTNSPTREGIPGATPWGACVTGASGSGKSALFAALYRPLSQRGDVLVLANAAGATPRGSSVDAMLRRWISELAGFLKVASPLTEESRLEEVENAFHSLLGQAAMQRRVVVLLDALNQFETTPRGQHLTWFKPGFWPANARLLATTIPGTASATLTKAAGIDALDLPPLTTADAREIGRRVWRRYHREINPTVLECLVAKRRDDGQPAHGSPLWLTLALEQLNLLDADDFARAERDYEGNPGERLAALVRDTAEAMPADIEGLYRWLLNGLDKAYGAPVARGYALAIALSRQGWREADLQDLSLRLGRRLYPEARLPEALDELPIATLRRAFRHHLMRRGQPDRLDFFHLQTRQAVFAHCGLREEEARRPLHGVVVEYLEGLPADDPMQPLERMGQLIGLRDALRAGRYYATLDASQASVTERTGSTWALVDWLADAESEQDNPHLPWLLTWLEQEALTPEELHCLSYNLQFGLFDRMENDTRLPTRTWLILGVREALVALTARDSDNADWQRDLSASHSKIGDVLTAQGDGAGALAAYRKSHDIFERLAARDPANTGRQRDLSVSFERIGDVLTAQGDGAGALAAYRKSLEIAERLAARDPANTGWQRDLSVSHNYIGDVLMAQGDGAGAQAAYRKSHDIFERLAARDPDNTQWQHDLSVSHDNIGNVLTAQGDGAGALAAYRKSLEIRERLAARDPANTEWQRDLSVSHDNIGNVLTAQGDGAGALAAYRKSLEIRERLAARDPANTGWQRDLSVSHNYIGNVLKAQGDGAGALAAYRKSLDIRERLAALDPANTGWQCDLGISKESIGDMLLAQGDGKGALAAYREKNAIIEALAARDPANTQWQRDLSVSHDRVGNVLVAQGDGAGAQAAYRKSLEIRERLVARDPAHTGWQRDLSVSHSKIGDVLMAQGDGAGALAAYRKSLEIAERLAARDPANTVWQRDLSVSHSKIGDMLTAQGDGAGALAAYRKFLEIAERLTARHPTNAGWQRDLWVSHIKIGDVLMAEADGPGALAVYRESLPSAEALAAYDPSNAQAQVDVAENCVKLSELAQLDDTERRAYLRRGLEILAALRDSGCLPSIQEGWFKRAVRAMNDGRSTP